MFTGAGGDGSVVVPGSEGGTSGGDSGGGSVEPPTGEGRRRRARQVIAYMDVQRGGFATVGSTERDRKDFGVNRAGESVRPLYLTTNAFYHRSEDRCGPDTFGGEHRRGGAFTFPVQVVHGWDPARPHYYYDHFGFRRGGFGAWDYHTTSPDKPPLPGQLIGGAGCGPPPPDDEDKPGPDDEGGGDDPTGNNPPGNDAGGDGGGDDGGDGGDEGGDNPPVIPPPPGGDGGGDSVDIAALVRSGVPVLGGSELDDLGDLTVRNATPVIPPPTNPPPVLGATQSGGVTHKAPPPPTQGKAYPSDVAPCYTPYERGVPALVGMPSDAGVIHQVGAGAIDARYGAEDPAVLAEKPLPPAALRLEWVGARTSDGKPVLTTRPGQAPRYASGTGPSTLLALPPELGAEDVVAGRNTRRNLGSVSDAAFMACRSMLAVGAAWDLDTGLPVDAWIFEQDASDNLDLGYYDTTGAAAGVPQLQLANPLSTGSAVYRKVTTVTNAASPYTVAAADHKILVDTSGGAVTINLPAAGAGTRELAIINYTGANNVTVTPAGGDTVTSGGTLTPGQRGVYQSNNGTVWAVW